MGLMINRRDVGYIRADDKQLDRKLREGDGILWRGDPDLELRYGVLTAPKRMQHPATGRWLNRGDLVAKRYEVWAVTPDGAEEMLGFWRIEEFDRILYDVVNMKAGFEGRMPTAEDRIDARNAQLEREQQSAFQDAYGQLLDHYYRLWHDRNNPKTTFRQVGGTRDEK